MTWRRQTLAGLLTNIATAVNSNYCQPVNLFEVTGKGFLSKVFHEGTHEDIQNISDIISSSTFPRILFEISCKVQSLTWTPLFCLPKPGFEKRKLEFQLVLLLTKDSSHILLAWPVYGACEYVHSRFCKNLYICKCCLGLLLACVS